MREEKESITFLEEGYDSMSRYSKDGKYAYSIPEDGLTYSLRNGCVTLELKGRESMIQELILPTSFWLFYVESIDCLPYLRKITAYSEFCFVSRTGLIEHDVRNSWRDTKLEEICVLPWLVDKYKKMFGYRAGYDEAIIKVTAIPDDVAFRLADRHENGLTTSKNGKTLIKVDKDIKVLEIPLEIERVAASAFEKDNTIETVIIKGDSEDYHKDRSSLEFDKDAVNALTNAKTLIFESPMHTTFYDDNFTGAKMPNLKTIIYPLWNHHHYCFRGSEAESASIHSFEVKAKNFSSVELIEEDGIVYTKDGKYLVSGFDCKSKSIRIKDGVEEIFQYAFCCNLAIEAVYIPRSVTKVGLCAFKSCKNIKKIVFNFNQITKDAESAFFTYSNNINFYFPSLEFANVIRCQYDNLHNKLRNQGLGVFAEKNIKNNSVNVVVHTLPYYPGEVSIDEATNLVYDEKGEIFVGVLQEQAKDIVCLSLPNHIKDIYESAFSQMIAVEKIVAPHIFNAKQIYELAKKCPKLKSIVAGEEQIIIEDGIVYTHNYKEIIAASKTIKIPSLICKEGVEVIASSAFEGHNELKTIKLPQTIKSISDRAFANTGITQIEIPTSLKELGKEVFASCNLSVILYHGPIASGTNAFDGVKFAPSGYIKVQKIYKDDFIRKYPNLKNIVKTPLPKWLSWLE